MSTRGVRDVFTVALDSETVNRDEYLSDVSPRHKPWDTHRGEADDVSEVFAASPFSRHHRYAERVSQCSQYIGFARDPPTKDGKQQLKLKNARFCRVRYCPVCQWRRSLMWQARIYRALPRLVADYPQARFLFATFTVKNCDVHLLRFTLGAMCRGWKRLTELKVFPAIGWVRSVEVTRGRVGDAHPHFHSLLMVQPEYFGVGYLKQPQWAELWRQCLRIDYKPVVDIRVVDPDYEPWRRKEMIVEHCLWNAVSEILKYSVKVSDMLKDDQWFLAVSDEIWKTRAVAVGGVLKRYLREREREDLTAEPGEEPPPASGDASVFFGWKQPVRRYRKVGKSPVEVIP
jgi:plasmid rolling circle replication initiator protein Rep